MEEAVGRYLGVFLPFIATLISAHYIVRLSGSELLARTELASPQLFKRALAGTGIAGGLIIAVDSATGGDLFLRPRFPESQLLIALLLVGVLLAFTIGRSLAPLARRFKRIA
ncbi:MAG TPA: hypothetical protein VGT60_04425 [Candidatus Limnocylindria bacterium]|nr:hypothetical protein [Candidatus Limnocylindria bacterium]